ncbi:MAG: hypothetical protein PHC68_11610 [Syntrophorhabdaceae bacterium]|nr:hypothetical protein [Syntrophorhabdaceae bacterium]
MNEQKLPPISITTARAAVLAFLSYRTSDMAEKITGLREGIKCKFESLENGALKFGYVIDELYNLLYLIGRGTAGNTPMANLVSWGKYDLRLTTGEDGEHNGFQDAGNQYFEWLKAEGVLDRFHGYVTGSHSQGSGYMQRVLLLLSRHYPTRIVDAHLYAAPPYFKKGHELELSGFLQSPHCPMTVTRYVQPGDPIDAAFLRDESSGWRNGVDIGNEYTLPDLAIQKLGPAEAINHSCRFQVTAMIVDVVRRFNEYESSDEAIEVLKTLRYGFDNCIN